MFAVLLVATIASQGTMDLVSGQSLGQGGAETANAASITSVSTTQPYANKMPAGATVSNDAPTPCESMANPVPWPLVSLIESDSSVSITGGVIGESPRSGYANYQRSVGGPDITVVAFGKGGTAYAGIKKGTAPMRNLANQIGPLGARGMTVGWVLHVHSENDDSAGTTRATYAADLVEYQADIQALAWAVSQTRTTVYFQTWQTCFSTMLSSNTTLANYDAARAHREIILGGSECMFAHNVSGLHLTAAGSRQMGALAGKVRRLGQLAIEANPSSPALPEPLWPVCNRSPTTGACTATPATRVGAVITLQVHVPVCPMVVATNVSQRGFKYSDSAGTGTISSVDCTTAACTNNTGTCSITLSADPTGHTNKLISYQVQTPQPAGDVCDSDAATWQGASLKNCMVTFEEAVN